MGSQLADLKIQETAFWDLFLYCNIPMRLTTIFTRGGVNLYFLYKTLSHLTESTMKNHGKHHIESLHI